MKYKLIIAAATAACLLYFSCKKQPVEQPPVINPETGIELFNLKDVAVRYGQSPILFDFDKDGFADLKFGVVLVGDPVLHQDRREYRVSSGIHSKLAVHAVTENVPVMQDGDWIPIENFEGYNWWLVSSAILVQRVEHADGAITWNGHWKEAVKKYLPFQLINENTNQRYAGWVELTVQLAEEKIILHRMALSRVAEKRIRAGEW
jgi:hypothetical protein